ncbi:nitrilase superfamily member [Scheffersomyces coipomensis]|uniref:nitrilase superfamily member n=1 Tax=Scheffersomyces coipomensis TaxID=1788519 RepID=UPI00315C6EA3
MSKLRVAVGQLTSSSNIFHNATIVNKLISKSKLNKVNILFLPEATDYLSRNAGHSLELANQIDEKFLPLIQSHLKSEFPKTEEEEEEFYVAIGIHQPSPTTNRVQNNLIWINSQGEILKKYQKLHLFDVNIKNGPILQESKSVEPGKLVLDPFPVSSQFPDWKVGLAICYDIRFPELNHALTRHGANIITYPSAFTTKTGEVHWELLGKTRAIDSQSYIVMPAQCGHHDTNADITDPATISKEQTVTRISYGESLIIDPWGKVLVRLSKYTDDLTPFKDADNDYYELGWADFDYDHLLNIRKNMPLMEQRRSDVFKHILD